MRISQILSSRAFETWPSYHLVFEWEDNLSRTLSVPIVNVRSAGPTSALYSKLFKNRYAIKLRNNSTFKKLRYYATFKFVRLNIFPFKKLNLVFDLFVRYEPAASTSADSIPIIVDFWKDTNLENFYHTYQDNKLVLISSLEVLNYLRRNNCPLNIAHLPLSLPDVYQMNTSVLYPKQYDIVMAGRANEVLLKYLLEYTVKFPAIEFLQQELIDDELYYVSNKRGVIGKFHSREDYINLLSASKISFYSTPGMDNGAQRTGGFNPVTPRFLELLSAQCLLVGRYPENEETAFFELDKVCPNVASYQEFEAIVNMYLAGHAVPIGVYAELLQKHYTSCRANQLLDILQQQRR